MDFVLESDDVSFDFSNTADSLSFPCKFARFVDADNDNGFKGISVFLTVLVEVIVGDGDFSFCSVLLSFLSFLLDLIDRGAVSLNGIPST